MPTLRRINDEGSLNATSQIVTHRIFIALQANSLSNGLFLFYMPFFQGRTRRGCIDSFCV